MFAYCLNNPVMGYDPTGQMDWSTFLSGTSLLGIGLIACAAAATVVSGGACTPVLIAACITFAAGGMTVLNGTAEMIESTTGYNYMRDGVYGGNAETYEAEKAFFQTTAEIGTAFLGLSSGSQICFVAGTLVFAEEGTKAIELIHAGELVWAWDEETGNIALKEVVETYINETDELVHVFVHGEEIITTPTHPFYSPVKGWTEAAHLRAGDILVLVNGEYVVVEKVQHEILENPILVYNFQVLDSHTYFVSESGILVHNVCNGRGQLRANMLKQGSAPGSNYQAHHGLPWQFRDYFSQAGLDVNDASFGRWVLGGGNGGHQSWSYQYAKLWKEYIRNHPIADATDIIDYFSRLNGFK